eukprot:10906073-Karenia_brevis.AAC.1
MVSPAQGPHLEADSAWASKNHGLASSHVSSSHSASSPPHSSSSHIPSALLQNLTKMGITLKPEEDTAMGEEDMAAASPPTPCADKHLQNISQYQEMQSTWEKAVSDYGEESLLAKTLKEGLAKYGPQTTCIKTTVVEKQNVESLLS